MGLFDKLKEAVGNAIESSMNGPMNEEEKYYFDIVLNTLHTVRNLEKENIKAFIEHKTGKACPEATLESVLQKFESFTEPKTKKMFYRLTSTQSSRADYKSGGTSWYTKEEIASVCFGDFEEEIRSKFASIYEVVLENPSESILKQGLSKITATLPRDIPDYGVCSYYQIATKVIGQEIARLFYDGDSLIQEILCDSALSQLDYNLTNNAHCYIPHLYAFALRALHYEKADKTAENYVSITKDDCREAVNQSETYQDDIKERPFDKEDILRAAVNSIFESTILPVHDQTDWQYVIAQDIFAVDAVCFFAWKNIAARVEETAETVEDAVHILHHYLQHAEEYEDSENTAVYNMIPDDVRSRLKPVDNDD